MRALKHRPCITNVEPLPDEVLERIYHKPDEEDEQGVRRFMGAQAFGGDDLLKSPFKSENQRP
jgi:hypothetical protein